MPAVMVFGSPIAKGSMKCIGQRGPVKHVVVDSKVRDLEKWEPKITAAGIALLKRYGPLDGPVGISITFTMARPASVPLSKRVWPITRSSGDIDKLERAVLDGLTKSGLIHDDSQVVHTTKWQCYPDTPGCPDRLDEPGAFIRIETIK